MGILLENRLVLTMQNLIFDPLIVGFEIEAGLLEQALLEWYLDISFQTVMLK